MARRGTTHQTIHTFDVQPGIGALHGAIANGGGPKSFILLVKFYDAHGELIPGPYLRFSHSRLGAFRYLAGGEPRAPAEFEIPLFVPDGARRLDAIFCDWGSATEVLFASPLKASGCVKPRLPQLAATSPRQFHPTPTPDAARVAAPARATTPPRQPARPGVVCEGSFEPGRLYEVDIEIVAGEGDGDKAHLLVVECFDATGKIMNARLQGLLFSDTAGCFVYVSFSGRDNTVRKVLQLQPPEGAASYRVLLKRWHSKRVARAVCVEQRVLLSHAAQVELVTHQVDQALRSVGTKYDSMVMITATTRAIESENRLNRPQVVAQEFARQGFVVFYIYYRFAKTDPLPERSFDRILQIPNDIFQVIAPRIARTQAKHSRIAVFSIPDDNSVRQLGVFQRFGWRTLYEVRDDWEEFAAANVGKWYNSLWERFLTTSCDQTICVSPALMSKMLLFGCTKDKVTLSHNATTLPFIEAAAPYRSRRINGRPIKHRPVLGYFGHLTEAWFDWPLIAQAASQRPGWDFEFIGFGAPKTLALPQNVTIKDAVPQLELPNLTQHWDIAMIPFRPSPLSRAVDPIKIYDYQALGLPTLSVPMSLIDRLDNVHIYEGLEDFLTKADALVSRLSSAALEWKIPPSDHTWTERVRRIVTQSMIKPPLSPVNAGVKYIDGSE